MSDLKLRVRPLAFYIEVGGDPELADAIKLLATPARQSIHTIDPRSLWQFGTARWVDESVHDFKPFGVFQDSRWQVEREFPSKGPLTYAMLGREEGHPAHGDNGIVVRRWTSPVDGNVKINSMVGHRSKRGDGIIAIIRVGDRQLFRETQFSNNRPVGPLSAQIKKGETVDFIAHSGASLDSDSFYWRSQLSLQGNDGERLEANSVSDFSGPFNHEQTVSLDRLSQLAQILFLTDEFAFVD